MDVGVSVGASVGVEVGKGVDVAGTCVGSTGDVVSVGVRVGEDAIVGVGITASSGFS